jgi:hypothetical protein
MAAGSTDNAIDSEMLERMARVARGLPGHLVSLQGAAMARDAGGAEEPQLRVDGVTAAEILDRYERLE